jgi:O-antigen/teichoic acid export membrane protein
MSTVLASREPLRRRVARRPALAAGLTQVVQAAGTFALQVAAAHLLGAAGLAVVSLCLGIIILGTALTSGLVGDSLTVLDRRSARIRAGLQVCTVALALGGAFGTAVVCRLTGLLDTGAAAALALAAVLFQVEEVLRRLFMANLAYWTLLVVDLSVVVATMLALGVAAVSSTLTISSFLLAVAVGQGVGIGAAVALLPASERWWAPWRGAAVGEVLAFGGWRGVQVALAPLGLTLSRVVVVAAAGTVALGGLEGARVIGAPAMLVVQGLGSYLLAGYARDRSLPLSTLRDRATRASAAMAGLALAMAVTLALLSPVLAPVVVGGAVEVSAWVVLGWGLLAAATATLQPFTSLAVTRGRAREVLMFRALDVAVGVGLLATVLGTGLGSPALVPYLLLVGPLLSGMLVRLLLLRHPDPHSDPTSEANR